MYIKAVKFRKDGFYIQPFVFGGEEGRQLPKFQIRENSTKLYIPQDNRDFAVVSAEQQGEMSVNFKAKENGIYTITVSSTLNSQLSTLNYAPGIYVLRLTNGEKTKTQKIVIE